jgi:hypothetical protein
MKKPVDNKKFDPKKGAVKGTKDPEPEVVETGPHIFQILADKVKANIIEERSIFLN